MGSQVEGRAGEKAPDRCAVQSLTEERKESKRTETSFTKNDKEVLRQQTQEKIAKEKQIHNN